MTTFTETVMLETMECVECAGVFAVLAKWAASKRKTCGTFRCPYCNCSQGWFESESDRLRKQLETKERELRESKCATLRERQLRETADAEKAKAQRKVQRATNGTCTICNRSFKALRQHMASKHPEHTKCVKEQPKC